MERELAKTIDELNDAKEESLNSTKRMMQLCNETIDSGIKTLVMLDEQGEQLDRTLECNDRMHLDLKDAEDNLEGLEKCCGLFTLPWKRRKRIQYFLENDVGIKNADGPRRILDISSNEQPSILTGITKDKVEKEMNENLGQVSVMISNLRNMAIDIGQELDHQTEVIEAVRQKTGSINERIRNANKIATKILNRKNSKDEKKSLSGSLKKNK